MHAFVICNHCWAASHSSYETAATLLLRGVLKPDNPAHAAILAQYDGGRSGCLRRCAAKHCGCCATAPRPLAAGNCSCTAMPLCGPDTLPPTAAPAETAAEQQHDSGAPGSSRQQAAPAAAAEVKQEAGGSRDRKRQRRQQEEVIDLTKVGAVAPHCCAVEHCDLGAANRLYGLSSLNHRRPAPFCPPCRPPATMMRYWQQSRPTRCGCVDVREQLIGAAGAISMGHSS